MIRIVLTNAHDRVFQDPNVQLVFYPINKYPINNVGVAGDGRAEGPSAGSQISVNLQQDSETPRHESISTTDRIFM